MNRKQIELIRQEYDKVGIDDRFDKPVTMLLELIDRKLSWGEKRKLSRACFMLEFISLNSFSELIIKISDAP